MSASQFETEAGPSLDLPLYCLVHIMHEIIVQAGLNGHIDCSIGKHDCIGAHRQHLLVRCCLVSQQNHTCIAHTDMIASEASNCAATLLDLADKDLSRVTPAEHRSTSRPVSCMQQNPRAVTPRTLAASL